MVKGSDPNYTGVSNYTPYTGLGIARPVAVNPSNEEYLAITGSECPYKLNYDYIKLGDNQDQYAPIAFLMENQKTGLYHFCKFLVSDRPETSSKGSLLFINKLGAMTWSQSPETLSSNPKMTWFTNSPFRPTTEGFAALHNFLQALTVYNNKDENAQWLDDMAAAGVTAENIYTKQDISGLRSLIAWANKQDHSVVCLYTVREVIKDGSTSYYQHIETGNANKPLFFRSARTPEHSISAYTRKLLMKMIEDQSKQGYNITSRHYSVDFQEFAEPTACSDPAMAPASETLSAAIDNVV